jgi:hypothetical protein
VRQKIGGQWWSLELVFRSDAVAVGGHTNGTRLNVGGLNHSGLEEVRVRDDFVYPLFHVR